MKKYLPWLMGMTVSLLTVTPWATANTYSLNKGDVVGKIYKLKPNTGITMYNLVDYTEVGFEELAAANPGRSYELHNHRKPVIIPSKFVLPNVPKKGMVINVAELRLYYYPKNTHTATTYPVGIGRKGWQTPLTTTKIVNKKAGPTWKVPKSIQLDVAARKGVILPDKIPPGEKNPLGTHAIYLGLPGYLIHGTNAPYGVGQRVSSGCVRLMPRNIISLYNAVQVGDPVRIISQPYKVGWAQGKLYLEAHPVPHEYESKTAQYKKQINQLIKQYAQRHHGHVDWNKVQRVIREKTGIPQVIST